MRAEERIFQGIVFNPGDPELKAIKLRTHNLDVEYNQTFEDETEKRAQLLSQMVGQMGEGGFIQGPVYFHYGKHTKIGSQITNLLYCLRKQSPTGPVQVNVTEI